MTFFKRTFSTITFALLLLITVPGCGSDTAESAPDGEEAHTHEDGSTHSHEDGEGHAHHDTSATRLDTSGMMDSETMDAHHESMDEHHDSTETHDQMDGDHSHDEGSHSHE